MRAMARQARRRDPEESLFVAARDQRPLAARMRPRSLDEVAGQQHVVAPGTAFRAAVERGETGSLILWGPPGTGKTTLAHLIATATQRAFMPFSAVSEGVPRLREIFDGARERLAAGGSATVLFVDEIHRLNKAQQDTLLPAVEDGTVTLIGATTENPSFELNAALLSRARVVVLQPLAAGDIEVLVRRALEDPERGLGAMALAVDDDVVRRLAEESDGDARRALTVLEVAAQQVGLRGRITLDALRDAMQRRMPQHDRAGEAHYNMLSAYHKSLRGSDPQGALYWMARMLEAGEDPLVLCRRAIAMAAEDVGLADPQALQVAVAARDAVHMLGAPEAYLPLAEMTVYLATAPKSNSVKAALDAALDAARRSPAAPVPVHLRNAPTRLMKDLGYGREYRYAHDDPTHFVPQDYLPEEVRGERFYEPGGFGFEKRIAERMAWWAARTAEAQPGGGAEGG
ncbi:MAG TPA: replication-associated recombination protein A [Gemmatimonadales bacterium]|nr:replication-associated recombination protein A [Gemmatimonadales bacterium]